MLDLACNRFSRWPKTRHGLKRAARPSVTAAAVTLRQAPAAAVIVGIVAVLAVAVLTGFHTATVVPLATILVIVAAWHRSLLRWPSLLVAIIAVILFVPN